MAVQSSEGERCQPGAKPLIAREMSTRISTRPMSKIMARILRGAKGLLTPGFARDRASHDPIGQFQNVYPKPAGRGHAGKLEPDEPGARDDHPASPLQLQQEPFRVSEGAQPEHTVQIRTGDWKGPVVRSDGQHQVAVGQMLSIAH